MNRIHPQNIEGASFGSTKSLFTANRVNRLCVTSGNQTGFLCDNRASCIPASQVCDARQNCANGEDEQGTLCDDLPNNLPGYLIFYCSNRKVWVYADKKCNGINDCGDCSDEVGAWASCPPCGPQWWGCTMVVFHMYCSCIPRRLCRDGIQHCSDWSDEYICTR
ncbi:low-density lipoprotein receptor class A domain-containing protein 1 isoform X2 [Podarcis lilfordi]|uniref:Low-density lipoprotein receptor class A domain-containing protein 1 isoform X2 n=1 Tax=Podarcis lilfordi TaxID=74358 RepID=A0AA35KGY3_9SAUR|nr:low-density lipoprotein receptor class A domain-containing protein 1 isoform X2 [Podarcis lilfordi]